MRRALPGPQRPATRASASLAGRHILVGQRSGHRNTRQEDERFINAHDRARDQGIPAPTIIPGARGQGGVHAGVNKGVPLVVCVTRDVPLVVCVTRDVPLVVCVTHKQPLFTPMCTPGGCTHKQSSPSPVYPQTSIPVARGQGAYKPKWTRATASLAVARCVAFLRAATGQGIRVKSKTRTGSMPVAQRCRPPSTAHHRLRRPVALRRLGPEGHVGVALHPPHAPRRRRRPVRQALPRPEGRGPHRRGLGVALSVPAQRRRGEGRDVLSGRDSGLVLRKRDRNRENEDEGLRRGRGRRGRGRRGPGRPRRAKEAGVGGGVGSGRGMGVRA
jgi:hypothetical protein